MTAPTSSEWMTAARLRHALEALHHIAERMQTPATDEFGECYCVEFAREILSDLGEKAAA